MRRDCEQTRKSLRKYLQGHLFKPEQIKIERHLKKCALCSSELQALKRAQETKKLLKDITPPESVVERVKEGVSVFGGIKKLLYRPLWIAAIIAAAAGTYFYVVIPITLYFERERAEVAALSSGEPAPAQPPSPQEALSLPQAPANVEPSAPTDARSKTEPLVITVLVEDERQAIERINSVMEGHAVLRSMRFSEKVKEISGSLTQKELLTLFNRIEPVGQIRYSRSRFESFPSTEPLPFVMRLKAVPAPPAVQTSPQASQPAAQQPQGSVEKNGRPQ